MRILREELRRRAPGLFAAIGLAEIVAYFLAPAADAAIYLAIGASGSLAIVIGLRMYRPRRRGWLLIGWGVAIYCLGDALYTYLVAVNGADLFPSVADGFYLGAELLMLAGVASLARPVAGRLGLPALLDGGLVATAFGFLVWVTLLDPISATTTAPLAGLVAVSYPIFDIALLGVLVSLVFLPGRKGRSALLLAGGIAAWLCADLVFAYLSKDGSYVSGSPVDLGWLLGYVLFGAAALHPSMASLVTATEPHEATLSNPRLGLIGAMLMTPVAVFVAHGPFVHPWDFPAFAAGSVVLCALGSVRLLGSLHQARRLLEEQRTLQAKVDIRARTDGLTELANRDALFGRLCAALAGGDCVGFLFVDLDDFKRVNDAFGHPVGDQLLRAVAGRLRSTVRDPASVARLGGDEFAIVVSPCPTRSVAEAVAQRVVGRLIPDIVIDGRAFRIRPSIGVVWTRPGELSADEVFSRADIAMYLAKEEGDSFVVFEPAMHDRTVERTQMRGDLEGAAGRGEIEAWYQPITASGRQIVAVEALARWRHPGRGTVSPVDFVPLAELSGEIVEIDRAMLAMATRTVAGWNAAGRSIQLHVNISPREVADPRTVRSIADALDASGLRPSQLIVEMTETALVEEAVVAPVLAGLKDLGVRLSIDDFGSRYAVLALLGRLPFDILKLDQSLIRRVETPEGFRLLQGIVRLAESLRLETIAEGVETAPELALLRRLGCTAFQGYLLGKPMPAGEFASRYVAAAEAAEAAETA